MDMLLFLWALVATMLFFWEKYNHQNTRYEYLEYRSTAELTKVIDDHVISKAKPLHLTDV